MQVDRISEMVRLKSLSHMCDMCGPTAWKDQRNREEAGRLTSAVSCQHNPSLVRCPMQSYFLLSLRDLHRLETLLHWRTALQ